MQDPLRQEIAATADTIVVKVGTRVLTHGDGTLDMDRVTAIAEQLARAVDAGRKVVLVSSGAVGAGLGRIGLAARPADLAQLQAVAALGQSRLIEAYNQAFETHGHHAAQILLTADDFNGRARYLNIRNTIHALFEFDAIPIINENDTVRVYELQRNVGDNDRLAAMVTNLIRAPLLVLLSDIAGLYDGNPNDAASTVIPVVKDIDQTLCELTDGDAGSREQNHLSTGGIRSKLEAVQMVTTAGENAIIANGREPNVLDDILAGKPTGTLFLAEGASITSRKRWIGLTASPVGTLVLDKGAERAIVSKGSSLLAIGVVRVEGDFQKGDVVTLANQEGQEIARGLINYHAEELKRIAGRKTEEIVQLLGHRPYLEVVHRDNLVALAR